MYIHGMWGRRTRNRIESMKKFGLDVYAEFIDYNYEPRSYEILRDFAIQHQVEFLVGHSQGGLHAFWLAEDLGLPCFLSNPHLSIRGKKGMSPTLANMSCPLCVLALGEDDRSVDSARTLLYLEQHPNLNKNIKLKMLEGAGHRIDEETFEEMLQWALEEVEMLT